MHEKFIQKTFELARQGFGLTRPNPLVGAVLVSQNKIIAQGFHEYFGGPHAERDLFQQITTIPDDAILYCNLEPCCPSEQKKTLPCAPLLIEKKIKKLVISNIDPNPAVAGKGIKSLEAQGIQVTTGILEKEGEYLNRIFFYNMRSSMPYCHLKMALSLDGKSATPNGHSKWISGEKSREKVQHLRAGYGAILIGGETLRNDNPTLTVRQIALADHKHFKQPKVLVMTNQPLPESSQLLQNPERLIIISKTAHPTIKTIIWNESESIPTLLKKIYQEKIHSVFIEAGANLAQKFIAANMINEFSFFIAPKIVGAGISLNSPSLNNITNAITFDSHQWEAMGEDIYFHGVKNVHGTH